MPNFIYEAVLTPDCIDGGFTIHVPDLDGCFSQGNTYSEAVEMATDALKTFVAALIKYGDPIPEPIFGHPAPEGGHVVVIAFEADVDYLVDAVYPSEAAEMLGVSRSRVSQMIRSGQLESYQCGILTMVYTDSVKKRLADSPKAGRPRIVKQSEARV